jgi:hypothetical protein
VGAWVKRFLCILIIAVGLLMILAGVGAATYTALCEHPAGLPLPDQLASLPRVNQIEGQHAVKALNRLHRTELNITAGAIGHYGAKQEATLWVAGVPFQWMARKMVEQMDLLISQGESPFHLVDKWSHEGHQVYELNGMGQQHYYFQSGRKVIWLGIDESFAEAGLAEIMSFYP